MTTLAFEEEGSDSEKMRAMRKGEGILLHSNSRVASFFWGGFDLTSRFTMTMI